MMYNDNSILRQIPHILRARGFRLYLQNNHAHKSERRLIDLWLNGGAAVLGHTPPNMLKELKNTASRGLYAPYPHFTESRFLKALQKLFPERAFRLYAAPPEELSAAVSSGSAKLWRPFAGSADSETPILIPVLPGLLTWRGGLPSGLCVAACLNGSSENAPLHINELPESDILPPVLLAVAARGIYDILSSPQRAKPNLPRVFKALKNDALSQKGQWRRDGIYLSLKKDPEHNEWQRLFEKFLEAGFLLPPSPSQPLILPGELSAGEDAKLAAMLSVKAD